MSLTNILDSFVNEEGDWIDKNSYKFLYKFKKELETGERYSKTVKNAVGGKQSREDIMQCSDKYERLNKQLEYLKKEKPSVEAAPLHESIRCKLENRRITKKCKPQFFLPPRDMKLSSLFCFIRQIVFANSEVWYADRRTSL